MSLLSNGKYKRKRKIPRAKAGQKRAKNNDGTDDDPTRKTDPRTSYLPDDCLNLIFKRLTTSSSQDDRNSFGLTCRQWLHIQNNNNNQDFFVFRNQKKDGRIFSLDESFPIDLCKLLNRFQHLKILFLEDLPEIKDFATLKPPSFEAKKVIYLSLNYCYENADIELPSMFSCFPRLTFINLSSSHISDKGLEALAKSCSSLTNVTLGGCAITDLGISFLLNNCRKLRSLCINSYNKITGIGFLECPKTLTRLKADKCEFTAEGIKAIVSGGGLEWLSLPAPYELARKRSINTEAVVVISKGCPLLKELILTNCQEVGLEGWEAIGQNCKNLESLDVRGCKKLCDIGLQALYNGCSKLSRLLIDENGFNSSTLELFMSKKPQCKFY